MINSPIQFTARQQNGVWETVEPVVTQGFGYTPFAIDSKVYGLDEKGNAKPHTGIDFRAPIGTRIFMPFDAVVSFRENAGYGKHVKIRSEYKALECVLGHLSEFPDGVRLGDQKYLNMGDLVGLSGNTGTSTSPHLHYGTRRLIRGDGDIFSWGVENWDNIFYGYIDPLPFTIRWKGTFTNKTL